MNNTDMQQGFEWEAKVVHDRMFWEWSLIALCQERHIKPRSLTEQWLIQLGVAYDKLPIIMPILASKILEYYGIQAWELKNAKRIDDCKMSRDHYELITKRLSAEWAFSKFLRSNCWDRVDHDGEGTQFDKMATEFWTLENASQKIIVIEDKETTKVLKKRYEDDVDRIKNELKQFEWIATLWEDQQKRKTDLEKSLEIFTTKLKEIDADSTWGDRPTS